jgi:hypothetical protein
MSLKHSFLMYKIVIEEKAKKKLVMMTKLSNKCKDLNVHSAL